MFLGEHRVKFHKSRGALSPQVPLGYGPDAKKKYSDPPKVKTVQYWFLGDLRKSVGSKDLKFRFCRKAHNYSCIFTKYCNAHAQDSITELEPFAKKS